MAGRLSLGTDPNSGDDVGDRDYNDARYVNHTDTIDADTLDGIDSTGFLRTNHLSGRSTTNAQSVDDV